MYGGVTVDGGFNAIFSYPFRKLSHLPGTSGVCTFGVRIVDEFIVKA